MRHPVEHPWNLTPKQAIDLQQLLRDQVRCNAQIRLAEIKTVAGADCAFDRSGAFGYAGVVVYTYPELEEIQRVGRRAKVAFPYVPGLLSFREAPLLLGAISKLDRLPDLMVFDGHGLAHPRGLGIASHMGLLLDRPTIGCAKSRLVGEHLMPGRQPGSVAPLHYREQIVGQVLRTRRDCKPIFVSVGHRITLRQAVQVVMACVDGYRIPRPIRDADRYVARLKTQRT